MNLKGEKLLIIETGGNILNRSITMTLTKAQELVANDSFKMFGN